MKDNLTTAKELLKKAVLLQDAELMQLANDLLANYETKEVIETVIEEYLKCLNCGEKISDLKRKSCTKCKKRKLKLVQTKRKSKPVIEEEVVVPQQNNQKVNHTADQPRQKSAGRREPIRVFQNNFNDDGKECVSDKIFDNKYGKFFNPSTRSKTPAKPVMVPCESCHKSFALSPSLYRGNDAVYHCDRCLLRKTGR